jgi:hypothetical protein
LKRDKLFFFATYEGLRERLGITSVANTIPAECRQEPMPTNGTCRFDGDPSIAPIIKPLLALYPLPNLAGNRHTFPFSQPTDEDYAQARFDWTISTSDTAFARFTQDETAQVRPLGFPWVHHRSVQQQSVRDGVGNPHLVTEPAQHGPHLGQRHEAQCDVTYGHHGAVL